MHDTPISSAGIDSWKLLDILSDQIVVLDARGQLAYANAPWRLFARQYLGPDWRDMSVLAGYRAAGLAAALNPLEDAVRLALEGVGEATECEFMLTQAGREQGYIARVSAYEANGVHYALVEQRMIDPTIEREREFTRVILDNLSDAVVACNAEGRLVIFNQAARRWHNLGPDDALAPDQWAEKYDLFADDGVTPLAPGQIPLLRAFNGEQVRDAGMAIAARDQQRRFVEASGDPLFNSQGEKLGAVVVMHDITDRKQIAEAQRELQAMIISAQEEVLTQLSTPLFPISRHAMVMPLIGSVDSQRAQQILETLLAGVERHRTQLVILDITGVSIVDSQVANTFIHAARAVSLLGAEVVITGIRPEVAQTIVGLGIDLAMMTTLSTLESGIEYALARFGRPAAAQSRQNYSA